MSRLLVVDDEQSICWGLTRLGESMGHEVAAASSAEQGLQQAERRAPDVVILDVRLPGMNGLTAIERFQRQLGKVPIIVITAYGDLKTAVEAVRLGAFDYIAKPFDVDKVKRSLVRALVTPSVEATNMPIGAPIDKIVGRSASMQEVYKRIALAASTDASVLLCGESGTCKALAAREIHRYSSRAAGPFIAVSVAALDPSNAESELFGHVRGAFAGADHDRIGLLSQANGGTLFLDEVAELPLPMQVKLLRALEHSELIPIGGTQPQPTDIRVISATRQNLLQRTAEGLFRHDLLFRLGAFQIDLPPLRDRPEDIADLARHFVSLLAEEPNQRTAGLTREAIHELERRPWHGNVRELRNAIEHALVMARGRAIVPEHLPPSVSVALDAQQLDRTDQDVVAAVRNWAEQNVGDTALSGRVYEELVDLIEPPLLEVALDRHRGQCAAAARTLGIHRTTLRKKLTQHGIDDDSSDGE